MNTKYVARKFKLLFKYPEFKSKSLNLLISQLCANAKFACAHTNHQSLRRTFFYHVQCLQNFNTGNSQNLLCPGLNSHLCNSKAK